MRTVEDFGGRKVIEMNNLFWRVASWTAFLVVAGIAAVLSLGIADAVMRGEIRTVAKSGQGVLHRLSENPFGFWANVVPHLILAGAAWAIAYWFWSKELRKGNNG